MADKNVFFDKTKLKDGFALINKNERFSNEYMFMGTKLRDFYMDHPGKKRTPSWIKQIMYVISFYLDTARMKSGGLEHQDFFMSTSTVRKIISNYSNHEYCMRTIEKNWVKLETYGFVNIIPNPVKRSEACDKLNYHRRVIKLNLDFINRLLSVYSYEDPIYRDLGKRSILKKFIKARPISYIGNNNEAVLAKFKEYLEAGIALNEGYENSTDMVYRFADNSTKKYRSISKLTNIYTPQFLVSQEEKVNNRIDATPKKLIELTEDDIAYLEDLSMKKPVMLKEEVERLMYKAKVLNPLNSRASDIGIVLNNSFIIVDFKPQIKAKKETYNSDMVNKPNDSIKEKMRALYDAIR